MPVVVKNVGPIELGSNNNKNTSIRKSTTDVGTVRVFYENIEYVFGPNDAKTLENGIGANLVSQDSRLRIMDSRDGAFSAGRS